jgi:hypothetical protein
VPDEVFARPTEDQEHPIDLVRTPTAFFEAIMGSSHFINSTGSLW